MLNVSPQVEDTMKNPEFMAEMKKMMDTPEMKAALAKVSTHPVVITVTLRTCYPVAST